MKKLFWFAAVMVLCLTAMPTMAQSAFDGTWKINRVTYELPKVPPRVYLLQNGMWHCKSCKPLINVKADGRDYKIATDDPCVQTTNVRVVSDHSIEVTDKKNGEVTETIKGTVSPDGNTLMFHINVTCKTKNPPETSELTERRISKGPVGSHIISGSWRIIKREDSANSTLVTLRVKGRMLYYSDTLSQSFAAMLGGPSVPVKGSSDHATVAVQLIGKNTLVSTYKVNGKITDRDRTTVSADGKTITQVSTDARVGTYQIIAEKQ